MSLHRPLQISRILHAGYVFEFKGTRIAFDPILENPFSHNCYAFPPIRFDQNQITGLEFDAVFISHFHDDHCSLESLNFLPRKTPIYLFCVFNELFEWVRELGFTAVHPIQLDQKVSVGEIHITSRRALDADVDSIFHIQAGEVNVLNVVDSWIDPDTLNQLSQTKPWDLILWPFQTMREIEVIAPSRASEQDALFPPEWREQLEILNPRFLVPSSCQFLQEKWSWYNQAFFPISYLGFTQEIRNFLPQTEVVRLNPGTSIYLSPTELSPAPALAWIHPEGDQNVDYDFQPQRPPPPTTEIARHFQALTESQSLEVYSYCEHGLREKYQSMDSPAEAYFQNPRRWRLSIFDHRGQARHFYYLIQGTSLELLATETEISTQDLGWATEVPLAKFYAALVLGESLTSMYMRINDVVFSTETEKEIQDVDIVEDPLIRCLFNGVFGAYQKAQLQRIRALAANKMEHTAR